MAKRCIIKRDGRIEEFQERKIKDAIIKTYKSLDKKINYDLIREIIQIIKNKLDDSEDKQLNVEEVQDLVEIELINAKEHNVAKSYILYRSKREENRKIISRFNEYIEDEILIDLIRDLSDEFMDDRHEFKDLFYRFESFSKPGMDRSTMENMLVKAAAELTTKEAPRWENVAGRLLYYSIRRKLGLRELDFYNRIKEMVSLGLYGQYILDNYSEEEIKELEEYLKYERNNLFNYSGLELLEKRYLIRDDSGIVLEDPQEMFMGIAMHLGIPETSRKIDFVKELYDIISQLQVTMATPTMSNARRPFHQLSSCFIDTVPDSLDGIYRSIDNFAKVSKFGGGMGMYFGKVRASGSDIRGVKGAAGGVIRWIRLANDTAVAVDQLGVRQGSVAVYLDAWHKDIPEFLQLRTNNGDDRQKAHDVFPAVSYPDLFWRLAKTNINSPWYLFDPHEIKKKMGYSLEDYYGREWEKRYYECIDNPELSKRTISVKDLVRLIIVSITETGTPFTFYRDTVNSTNPNKHKGRIYSSNLCVTGDTRILTDKGYIQVDSLYESQEDFKVVVEERARLMSPNAKGTSIQKSSKMFKTGENQEVWKITLDTGQELKATPYHKMYVLRNEKIVKIPLHEVKIMDELIISKGYGKVSHIEFYGYEDVYDVTVENGHSLVFNGIATGNCTEIAQNMSPIETLEVSHEDGIVTTTTKAGDFVVCNLASLVLGRIELENQSELEHIIKTIVRALDNVISLNYYPIPYAEITNQTYRAIGLGSSDYHHALAKRGIIFSSEEHLEFMDKVYEDINYYAIKASSEIALEKGSYKHFKGSDWETGEYFDIRKYNSERWKELRETVSEQGLRNGYLMAIAPTGSTSIISGSSAGVDPIMKRYFLEEKKGSIVPRVAPGLNTQTFWTYENAHEVNQDWVVRAAGIRQRHIDQAQSVNLYITTEYTMRQILNLLILANEVGMKSIYYVRGKSLEVEDCDTCSA